MNFRSVADLFATVRRGLHKIPRDVDLIVGVPRSGMLAATAVSLLLHKPLTDLASFIDGRVYRGLSRRPGLKEDGTAVDYKSVLIVDDSIFSGRALQEVRGLLGDGSIGRRIRYAAVYGLSAHHPEVDLILEICPEPRVFEWNVMGHWSLGFSCVDLDGVLCVDPTQDENDDAERYIEFIKSARVLNAPRYRINSIVTSRLEKYRNDTERWLRENKIDYGKLYMLDLPSAEERRRRGVHAQFKGDIFSSRKDCLLFIESETYQAEIIRAASGKSVLAYKDMLFYSEGGIETFKRNCRWRLRKGLPDWSKRLIRAANEKLAMYVQRG